MSYFTEKVETDLTKIIEILKLKSVNKIKVSIECKTHIRHIAFIEVFNDLKCRITQTKNDGIFIDCFMEDYVHSETTRNYIRSLIRIYTHRSENIITKGIERKDIDPTVMGVEVRYYFVIP